MFYSRAVKRVFDILLSTFFLILSMPLIVVASLILIVQFRKLPIFLQERGLTLDLHRLKILKLRTIGGNEIDNAAGTNKNILFKNDLSPNTTLFSRWLRKTGIDELLQLLNVLSGKMSLVGPRPLMISDLHIMKEDHPSFFYSRTKVTTNPGITGMWQVYGERSDGIKNLIDLDMFYEKNISLKLDIKILLKTIPIMLFAKHSDAIVNVNPINKQEL